MANKFQEKKCPIKSDFFVKTSEKRQHKRQQSEQVCLGSAEEDGRSCPPTELASNMKTPRKQKRRGSSTPEKKLNNAETQQARSTPEKNLSSADKRPKSTPKKRGIKRRLMDPCIVPTSCSLMKDEVSSNMIPDLRMEAQKTAEENSRIYAGKEIHPFFSSWKIGKRKSEGGNLERTWCSSDKEERNLTLVPIHVLQTVEEDDITLDWQHWTFSERCILSSSYILENGCSLLSEESVCSLQFDTLHYSSNTCIPLPYRYEISVDQHSAPDKEVCFVGSPREPDGLHPTSPIHLDDETILQDNEIGTHSSFVNSSSCLSPDPEKHDKLLGEGVMSPNQILYSQPENCLWTNKYQPEKAVQVCGNGASVKILSEWLHSWHEKGSERNKDFTCRDTFKDLEAGDNIYLSDCESDDEDIENRLQNVLLITGPVGCGKSAAIYACAKEQGFQVIEVNASDWRNGALVKQRFGEAVESHWIQRTQKVATNAEDKHLVRPFSAAMTGTERSRSEVIELIPSLHDVDSQIASATPRDLICKDSTNSHGGLRTLVLFEDFDTALCEDRGFISTIQQLSETAKRPMILTSNSDNPVLPNNLDRLELCFAVPPPRDLLALAHMVCTAEQAKINTSLLERFVNHCEGDIRKTIMLLQFWCQGQIFRKGTEVKTYRPLLFDIDAGHLMLPKLIPWSFPCPLSVLVDEEITESMRMEEDRFDVGNIVEKEELTGCNNQSVFYASEDPNSITAKKEAMLILHGSPLDKNALTPKFESNTEFSNYSGSPVAFFRRHTRRKLDTVMFSDSDEEGLSSRTPIDLNETPCDNCEEANEMIVHSPPVESPTEMYCSLISEPLHCKRKRLKRKCSQADGTSHPNGMSMSCDFSSVPESSFVPESIFSIDSKLTSRTESYIDVNYKVEADLANGLLPSSMPHKLDTIVLESCNNHELLGCSSDINTMPACCSSEASQYTEQCVEDSSRAYQPLDECSRIDFNWRSRSFRNDKHHLSCSAVQETWKKLRKGHVKLREYVTSDQKDTCEVLNIGYRLSNLISEADLLSNGCQQLIYDSLDPSIVSCHKSQSYSWDEDQLQMSSIVAQHGICLFTKEIANLGLDKLSVNQLDLASEMLASSSSTMALGKLVGFDSRETRSTDVCSPKSCYPSKRNPISSDLLNTLQLAVPLRSLLSLRGGAFFEYLSALSRISRLEANRLSDFVGRSKQRRARVGRHYLASGGLSLSTEDISLLGQYNCYRHVSSKSDRTETDV